MNILHPISHKLLAWYAINKRDLPWRRQKGPYKIWVSEVMLQQTQVSKVTLHYNFFINLFPNPKILAQASEEAVLNAWQGMGYYKRALNLRKGAIQIMNEFNGKMPDSYNELLKIKGIGNYTAAAIASICYKEKKLALDGNLYRVFSRLFGIEKVIRTSEADKIFNDYGNELLRNTDLPGDLNQAFMDLGSNICKPKNPFCNSCPLRANCFAFEHRKQDYFPIINQKKARIILNFNYILFLDKNETYVIKRTENSIWKGLYEFPNLKNQHKINEFALFKNDYKKNISVVQKIKVKHLLTHREIKSETTVVKISQPIDDAEFLKHLKKVKISDLGQEIPCSVLILKIIKKVHNLHL